jgi:hypothetical protein
VLVNRENKTALVIDVEFLLTLNLFNTEVEKVTIYENLALGIKNIWKLKSLYTSSLGISAEGVLTQNFLIYLGNIGFTNNMLKEKKKTVLLQVCHSKQILKIPRTCCWILGLRMFFLLLTEPNFTNYLG